MAFQIGTKFKSYDDFCIARDTYEKTVYANYYKATSIALQCNENISVEVAGKLKYKRAYFRCKLSGLYRSTAVARKNTLTFKQGCNARFGIGITSLNNVFEIEITMLHETHNHECNNDLFRRMPNQRKTANLESKQFLERVANVKPDAKLLQFEVSKTSQENYQVKRKDIHNFNKKAKEFVGINDLDQIVYELGRIDGASVKVMHNPLMELQGIFFQDGRMKKYFKVYPEILMFDATYNLNDRHLALVLLLIMDGNGESQIV